MAKKLDEYRKMGRGIDLIRKINTCLPKKKAKKFDELEENMIAKKTIFKFNYGTELEKEFKQEQEQERST